MRWIRGLWGVSPTGRKALARCQSPLAKDTLKPRIPGYLAGYKSASSTWLRGLDRVTYGKEKTDQRAPKLRKEKESCLSELVDIYLIGK